MQLKLLCNSISVMHKRQVLFVCRVKFKYLLTTNKDSIDRSLLRQCR